MQEKKSKLLEFDEFVKLLEERLEEKELKEIERKEKTEARDENREKIFRLVITDGEIEELYIDHYSLPEVIGNLELVKKIIIEEAPAEEDDE